MSLPQAGIVRYNMRFCVALLIFCASLATPPATLAQGIIGKDQRQKVPSKYDDLSAGIGLLLDRANGRTCTAFCVADDVIVSNAHCLTYHRSKKSSRPTDLRFFNFYLLRGGKITQSAPLKINHFGKAGAPQMSILMGEPPRGRRRLSTRQWMRTNYYDWAVARLNRPACAGDVLQFADADLLKSTRALKRKPAFLIAFHGDLLKRRDRLPRYSPCRIQQVKVRGPRRLAYHNCDLQKGASGSPIFVNTEKGPRVVAIVTGVYWQRKFRRYRNGRTVTTSRWSTNLAVLPLEFVDNVLRFQSTRFVSKAGANRFSTSDLQQKLKAAGYYKARVDGDFGPKTKAALMRFERAAGLVPLGLPTADLLDKLDAEQRDTSGTAGVSTSSTSASND